MKNLSLAYFFITLLPGIALAGDQPRNIAEGIIYRHGTIAEITNIFSFHQRPNAGETVTIVPLTNKVPPQSATIKNVSKGAQCTDNDKPWFQIDLVPVTSGPFMQAKPQPGRNASYPFDVAVLHPQNSTASYLSLKQFQPKDLPATINMNVVKGVVDLNKNGKPDIVFAGFCCNNRNKSHAEGCEYMCTETWLLKNGKWLKHDQSQPC